LLKIMTKRAYACGIGPAFEVVGGKWKAIILWELQDGPLRFGELRRRVADASEKMLIQQLRELERDTLISRQVFPEVPPRPHSHLFISMPLEWAELSPAIGPAYFTVTNAHPRLAALDAVPWEDFGNAQAQQTGKG